MSVEQWAELLFPEVGASRGDSHVWGNVKAVNEDGSYQVQLNASAVTTRCANCCAASVGDRVLVCVMANGRCAATAVLGGGSGDRVVAEGEVAWWTWRMWASGVAECWGETASSAWDVSSSWGSVYESPTDYFSFPGSASYPFSATVGGTAYDRLFCAAPPVCDIGFHSANNAILCVERVSGRTATRSENFCLVRAAPGTVTGSVTFRVSGRWKET